MNTSKGAELKTGQTWVSVFINDTDVEGLKPGEPALFIQPVAHLFEAPTSFLRSEYVESGRRASPHTWAAAAYALAGWFDFLTAIDIRDWRAACRNDLILYRDSFSVAISPKTGIPYSSVTIGNRMLVILDFYRYAGERGWYEGDILTESDAAGEARAIPIDEDELAHIRKGFRSFKTINGLIPKHRPDMTTVRPFFVNELRSLLQIVGPRATESEDESQPASRDRLICDLGWACGLRLDEIHQLKTLQFLTLHPDPEAPAAEQAISVVGKGRRKRLIAIPNWLVHDALAYIGGERKRALAAGGITGRQDAHQLFVSGIDSNFPGRPITHRRMQQRLEEACIAAGLVEPVKRTNPDTGEIGVEPKAKHSIHDLRHTYAVLTYWAEKKSGNSEPWKKIQVQLGHKDLATTTGIYLSFVHLFGEFERLVDIRTMVGR